MEQIGNILKSIKDKHSTIDQEARRIKDKPLTNKTDPNYWCLIGLGDALVKIRLMIEQNFNYIETMGILATTRYIFELSIWLKLFKLSPYYGFLYYSELVNIQKNHFILNKKQILNEICLLEDLDNYQKDLIEREFNRINLINDEKEKKENSLNFRNTIFKNVDDKAARHFSIYAEQAKTNGYSFQAYLIKNKVLPEIQKNIDILEKDVNLLKEIILILEKEMPKLLDKNKSKLKYINWKDKADLVNMRNEYEYIYALTSSLLHATPSSLTTNMKNLDLSEVLIFLKFIYVTIQDIIDFSKTY